MKKKILIIPMILTLVLTIGGCTPKVKEETTNIKDTVKESASSKQYTLEELSKYNGQNGNKAYVAYKGIVYDVTDIKEWKDGEHEGENAGTDLTKTFSNSPHGDSIFQSAKIVGKIKQ